jgi:nucleoside-diphosphate-sugar epimerase
MSKIPVLGTGLNGLVGSKFVPDFANQYDFDNLDLRNPQRPVDITNEKQVLAVLTSSPAKFVVHMAALLMSPPPGNKLMIKLDRVIKSMSKAHKFSQSLRPN